MRAPFGRKGPIWWWNVQALVKPSRPRQTLRARAGAW